MKRLRRYFAALAFYLYNGFVSRFPSYTLRHLYLTHVLRLQIGDQTAIHMGCFFTERQICIGNDSVINRNCCIDGRGGVEIGDHVSISPEVYIISLTHNPQDPLFRAAAAKVILEDYVWVGARAIIMPGVVLGKGCVVGAGAVVTRSFAPGSIVAGVPARKIGERNANLNYSLGYFPYFNTDISRE